LDLNINQIPVPDKVQKAVDIVNNALRALLVLSSLASGLTGLSFLLSLAVLILLRKKVTKPVVWANIAVTSLATLILLIESALITYVNNKGAEEINNAGKDMGISAIRGSKLITLCWVTFALIAITSLYWGLATLKYTQRWLVLADHNNHRGEKDTAMI
jgi:hypothetical protein